MQFNLSSTLALNDPLFWLTKDLLLNVNKWEKWVW